MQPLILGTNGSVAAIDINSGTLLWSTSLKTGGLFSTTAYKDISVLVRDGRVYAGGAGHLFCLDAQSGDILWHNPLEGLGYNDIALAMEGIAIQYLAKVEQRNS